MTAIPEVKLAMTGIGMNAVIRPSRSTPANIVAVNTLERSCCAIMDIRLPPLRRSARKFGKRAAQKAGVKACDNRRRLSHRC